MKLIHCRHCGETKALTPLYTERCVCGKTWGRYEEDGLHATVSNDAVVLGVSNHWLARNIMLSGTYPNDNLSVECWIMGGNAPHVIRGGDGTDD